MKYLKKILLLIIVLLVILGILYINNLATPSMQNPNNATEEITKRPGKSNLVSRNGALYVDGTSLKNIYGETFKLKGLSSHGIQWFYDIITYENLKYLRDIWGINVFRIAMYTNEDGYISNPEEVKNKAYNIINMCIDLDLYVIIDWHILSDGDPNIYKEQAKSFFNETSLKYKDIPNLIYEICNEPNQSYVTWSNHIKPYAEEIIPIIRNNSSNSIILVGTPDWSKDILSVSNNPLSFSNIMYTIHFYAASHKTELQHNITYALENNIPIFISEWGTTDANGNGTIDIESSYNWINFMDLNNLSWVNWSFCNKNEASAILLPNYVLSEYSDITNNTTMDNLNNNSYIDSNIINNLDSFLSESGKFIKSVINTKTHNSLYENY